MHSPVIAVFDAGKTNKKLLLFDKQYRVVHEESQRFEETTDEDGFPCENVHSLRLWIGDALSRLKAEGNLPAAVNFSSYGASFVHIAENGEPVFPLYNYLKPYPADIEKKFFDDYGGVNKVCRETASPWLGHLNSGLLLYRLKYQRDLLETRGWSLHLPQYLSYVVTGKCYSDITSIGCHTMLWNFEDNYYHRWVNAEGIQKRLAPIFRSDEVVDADLNGVTIKAGIGLHDSSSALIPYLSCFFEPFVLISTGTWSISMNPFNDSPLTQEELQQDCLCYMTYRQNPVKASRLFAGNMHEEGVKLIASQFNIQPDFFSSVTYDPQIVDRLTRDKVYFDTHDTGKYADSVEAYHALMLDIMYKQVTSTNLVMNASVTKIFVDGGFGKNNIYMKLLSAAYPKLDVYAASVPQATAMGAALAIHKHWNEGEIPSDVVRLVQAK